MASGAGAQPGSDAYPLLASTINEDADSSSLRGRALLHHRQVSNWLQVRAG